MAWRHVGTLALTLLFAACATGDGASGFINASVAAVFIPLAKGIIPENYGAAVVIAPGIAVTNGHNINLVDSDTIIGRSQHYDMLFFRPKIAPLPLPTAAPVPDEPVIAYGFFDDLRVAQGVVRTLHAPVTPICAGCAMQEGFTYEADAGPGFSGGPVLDAKTGRLVGITFGYLDDENKHRLMYAYDMGQVFAELARIQATAGARNP
jgi:hypothetical protein